MIFLLGRFSVSISLQRKRLTSHIWCECQDTARHGSHHSLPCLLGRALQSTVLPGWTSLVICREGFEAKHFEWGRPVSIKRCSRGGHLSSLGAVGAQAPRHSGRTQEVNRVTRETGTRPGKQERDPKQKNTLENREQNINKIFEAGIRNEYIMKYLALAFLWKPNFQNSKIQPKTMVMNDGKPDGGCLAWTIVASSFMVSFLQDGFRFLNFFFLDDWLFGFDYCHLLLHDLFTLRIFFLPSRCHDKEDLPKNCIVDTLYLSICF